jgi:hypothetical protein
MPDTSLDQVATYIYNLISTNAGPLGLRGVTFSDETLTKDFPSVVVIPGDLTRTPMSSQRITQNDYTVLLYVLHADMRLTRSSRSHADLQLAASVVSVLHSDPSMGGLVAGTGGWVAHERWRGIPYRKALNVLSTELTWHGIGRGSIF